MKNKSYIIVTKNDYECKIYDFENKKFIQFMLDKKYRFIYSKFEEYPQNMGYIDLKHMYEDHKKRGLISKSFLVTNELMNKIIDSSYENLIKARKEKGIVI